MYACVRACVRARARARERGVAIGISGGAHMQSSSGPRPHFFLPVPCDIFVNDDSLLITLTVFILAIFAQDCVEEDEVFSATPGEVRPGEATPGEATPGEVTEQRPAIRFPGEHQPVPANTNLKQKGHCSCSCMCACMLGRLLRRLHRIQS